jgi:multidrug efflux pump subunit AcrA (membrane-fusion protein)
LADEDGFPHKAVVDFIDPQVNASTGTVRVRGVIANPKGLMSPGMFARVRLTPPGK